MNDSDQEPDLFTQALRDDLPSERDEARVRTRLIAAGVLAGASVVAPSTAAAATTGGFFSKLSALPLAVKIGASVVVVSAAAVPVIGGVASQRRADDGVATVALVATNTKAATVALVATNTKTVKANDASQSPVKPAAAAETEPAAAAEIAELAPAAGRAVPELPVARAEQRPARATTAAVPEGEAVKAAEASALPAVGAFPAEAAAPVDEGTLRAETALIEGALSALRRNDWGTARRELARHAARFPDGHLKLERERALERTLEKEMER